MSSIDVGFGGATVFNEWASDPTKTFAFVDFTSGGGHRDGVSITIASGLPGTANISSVVGNYSMVAANLSVSFVTVGLFARSGGVNGAESNVNVFNDDPESFGGYSAGLAGPGGAWTVAKLDAAYLCAVNGTAGSDGSGNGRTRWRVVDGPLGYLSATVTYTLAAPTAATNAATNVTTTSAQINGTLSPNGANAAYPVSYKFQWGLTAAYGNETALVGGQVGSSDIAVSEPITGLVGNTTYHFRLVATNADNTVNGSDLTFTTQQNDASVMVF